MPKRYLFDTGVLRHLRELAVPSISVLTAATPAVRGVLGGVIENQTAIDLARLGCGLAGWKKTPAGNAIDFIARLPGDGTAPVECKASLSINRRHMKGLLDYLGLYSLPTGVLVSAAPHSVTPYGDGRRIVNVPAYLLERLPELIASGSSPGDT